MTSSTVIIFGPTGDVGSAAARVAAELGADVVLAMRNTDKPIPGLDTEKERAGRFHRVQADLTKPETVYQAVDETKAKKAFIYLAWGSGDHMKGTISALKRAGIDEVVFLSGAAVHGALRDIPPEELVPYMHAQVEANLEDVFGAGKVYSLRPGSFATNLLQFREEIRSGTVKMGGMDLTVDCIAPADVGRVAGIALAQGIPSGERQLYLYGPRLWKLSDCVKAIAKSLDIECKTVPYDKEEDYKKMVETEGQPPQMARYVVERKAGNGHDAAPLTTFGYALSQDQLQNVEKYTGRPATTFEEWLEGNKNAFR